MYMHGVRVRVPSRVQYFFIFGYRKTSTRRSYLGLTVCYELELKYGLSMISDRKRWFGGGAFSHWLYGMGLPNFVLCQLNDEKGVANAWTTGR